MTIGCAEGYRALVVRQPGASTLQGSTPTVLGELSELLSVEWGRSLSSTSRASVSVSKCAGNCTLIAAQGEGLGEGFIDPWAYELWLYRDNVFAWGGPIIVTREKSTGTFDIQALDQTAYVSRRKINAFYTNTDNAAAIAYDLATTFFAVEDPELIAHMVFVGASSGTMTVEYDANQYVISDKWNDLLRAGFNFSTLGRYTLIFGQSAPNFSNPYVIDASDILGDLELVKDGTNFATRVTGLGEGLTATVTLLNSYFGLIDAPPVKFQDVRSSTEVADLTDALWEERYQFRPQLVVPANSSLSAQTEIFSLGTTINTGSPVALTDLIPGMRYDVQVSEEIMCTAGRHPMRLEDLKVTWTPEQQELIAVSLGRPGISPPEEA